MNIISRALAAVLLMTVAPLTAAQTETRAPPDPPQAEQRAEQPKDPEGSGDISKEIGHTVDAIRSYSAERRTEALANARRAADDLDRQMERLQQQTDQNWARMSQASRARSQATMADLRERRNALAEWVGGMRHSSTATWGEVRVGFVKSYHELADAIRKAWDEYDKDKDQNRDQADKTESDGKPKP